MSDSRLASRRRRSSSVFWPWLATRSSSARSSARASSTAAWRSKASPWRSSRAAVASATRSKSRYMPSMSAGRLSSMRRRPARPSCSVVAARAACWALPASSDTRSSSWPSSATWSTSSSSGPTRSATASTRSADAADRPLLGHHDLAREPVELLAQAGHRDLEGRGAVGDLGQGAVAGQGELRHPVELPVHALDVGGEHGQGGQPLVDGVDPLADHVEALLGQVDALPHHVDAAADAVDLGGHPVDAPVDLLIGRFEPADHLVLVVLDPGRGGRVAAPGLEQLLAGGHHRVLQRTQPLDDLGEQPLAPADVAGEAVDLAVDAVEVGLQRLDALEALVEGGDVVVELGADGVVGGGGLLGDAVELPAQLVEGAFEGGGAPGHMGRRRLVVGELVVGDLLHLRPQLPHRALQQSAAQRGPGQLGEVGRAGDLGRVPVELAANVALRSPRLQGGDAGVAGLDLAREPGELAAEALDAGGGPGQGLLPGLQGRQPVGDGRHLLGGLAQGLLARLHLARHPQQPAAHALGVGGTGGQRP